MGTASWALDDDGIVVQGRCPLGPLRALITRAGLASFLGRDRCEVSAGVAWEVFGRFRPEIIALMRRQYADVPGNSVRIDYAEVERRP